MKLKRVMLISVLISTIFISGCNSAVDFSSVEDCQSACIELGYEECSCKWPTEPEPSYLNRGSCLVENSTHCGNEGQCNCYCYNVTEPEGTMIVSELLENPVYDIEVKIEGEVSLLGQLFCPCFELTSGGEKVPVWHDLMVEDDETVRPPVSVEGIENGDWVIVTGELKSEGEYRALNDFWAGSIEKAVFVDASNAGGEVTVAVGDLLIVTLESNPTTGFIWTLAENSDESVLQEVGHEFVSPETTGTPVVGEGGEEVWTFKTLKEGASNISMEYIRPWEEDAEPAVTFGLTVIVE